MIPKGHNVILKAKETKAKMKQKKGFVAVQIWQEMRWANQTNKSKQSNTIDDYTLYMTC